MTLYVTQDELDKLHDLNDKCKIKGKNTFDTEWWLSGLAAMFHPNIMKEMLDWAAANKGKKIKVLVTDEESLMGTLIW